MTYYVINDRRQYLAIGAASSRAVSHGWVSDLDHAEGFRTIFEASDLGMWLGLPEARIIDHYPHPAIPADADATPVRTLAQVIAEAQAEEKERALVRASWTIKAATAGAVLLLILTGTHTSPAVAAPRHHHHHHKGRHHVLSRAAGVHPGARVDRDSSGSVAVAENPVARALHAIGGAIVGGGASAVDAARRYVGTNPTAHASLWCADFVNFIERKLGRSGTGSREAKSFLRYGSRVSSPQPGDIVVYNRRGGGHVGYYISGPAARPVTVSGNAGGNQVRVGVARLPVIAIVRPRT